MSDTSQAAPFPRNHSTERMPTLEFDRAVSAAPYENSASRTVI